MPGYDGTGPRGHGPMSGGGRGYCILKDPRTYGDALTGFAGLTGKPVTFSPVSSLDDIASLHFRACQVHLAIHGIHRRITILEAIKQGIGKPRRNAHRLVSGGAGFILKGASPGRMGQNRQACSLEQVGKTCCGREERCGKPPCGGE